MLYEWMHDHISLIFKMKFYLNFFNVILMDA